VRILTAIIVIIVFGAAPMLSGEEPIGHLVLLGGGSKPDAVMKKFIELSGGTEAQIVIFPTASEEENTGEYYRKLFADFGCINVIAAEVHSRIDAADPKIARVVRGAGGIWFSGGDQRRITKALLGTPVGEAVAEAFKLGAVVGGTSAGTACQSTLMITGDGDFTVIGAENVELWAGFGLFKGVIVDQHFVARRRHNRLISVVLEHPEFVGVGVDEATAVWVRPDGTFEVLGDGWVIVYDASQASVTRAPENRIAKRLGVRDLITHVLLSGDIYDVNKRAVVSDDGGHLR